MSVDSIDNMRGLQRIDGYKDQVNESINAMTYQLSLGYSEEKSCSSVSVPNQ